jgi:hypothetical protein
MLGQKTIKPFWIMLGICITTMFPAFLFRLLMQIEPLGLLLWIGSMIGKPEK